MAEPKARARTRKPQLLDTYRILAQSEPWMGVIAFDEFSGRLVKRKTPPFALDGEPCGEWSDTDDTRTLMWIADLHGFQPQEKDLIRAIDAVARENSFHEIRDYLSNLEWDRTERLPTLPSDAFGAEDTSYTRIAIMRWMISAVARVMKPGVKADNVLVLVGPQSRLKSTALAVLAGEWFTDAPLRFGDKETAMLLRGKWIAELAEMDAFNRAENSAAKSFFSTQVDRFRVPWGRRPADVPRQCVFAGTVNHFAFLKDDTGNRRYWPIVVGDRIRIDLLKDQRDQLWAEAVARFRKGEIWWAPAEEKAIFDEVQERHYIGDAWEPLVARYLKETFAVESGHEFTTTEVMDKGLRLDSRAMDRNAQARVGALMQRLGLKRERSAIAGSDGKRPYVYVRKKEPGDDTVEL